MEVTRIIKIWLNHDIYISVHTAQVHTQLHMVTSHTTFTATVQFNNWSQDFRLISWTDEQINGMTTADIYK